MFALVRLKKKVSQEGILPMSNVFSILTEIIISDIFIDDYYLINELV